MKIFTTEQVRQIDKYTIENEPISSVNLMERAAIQCTTWLIKKYNRTHSVKVIVGCGNNGGDGMAIARQLALNEYIVEVYWIKVSDKLSPDASDNLKLLYNKSNISLIEISNASQLPQISSNDVIIDALFGSGLTRPLEGLAAETVIYLNRCQGHKIAIDIPSGMPGEGVAKDITVFAAHYTLTFQFPFLSFLLNENAKYIGKWQVLNIGLHQKIINQLPTAFYITGLSDISIIKRPEFGHKGTFGHALLIAGSRGMAGAAILSSMSCLRTGCGLVTTHVPKSLINVVHTSFPEAIVSPDNSESHFTSLPDLSKYSSIGIGPGLGTEKETMKVFHQILENSVQSVVIDADAINIMALNSEMIKYIPKNTIITPHPVEFDRLFGLSANSYERLLKLQRAAQELGIYIVLKGHYTCIAFPDGSCRFNVTGNNGMATAGSGDVLTGIITSLLAQGYTPQTAAITGVYLHGLAGDIAAEEACREAMIASDIIHNISNAYKKIKLSKNEED